MEKIFRLVWLIIRLPWWLACLALECLFALLDTMDDPIERLRKKQIAELTDKNEHTN